MDKKTLDHLESVIMDAYSNRVTMDKAEQLAGEFLHAQLTVTHSLSSLGLDARMRKSGLKAVKATVYLEECKKGEKKPTEATLTALIDTNPMVSSEQQGLDEAEIQVEELERYYNIFQSAHVYFRQMARGTTI